MGCVAFMSMTDGFRSSQGGGAVGEAQTFGFFSIKKQCWRLEPLYHIKDVMLDCV